MSASCVFVVSRVVSSTDMSCSERYGYTKCTSIWTFLHSFIVSYNWMHTYRIVELYRQCTVIISCYCLMFKPYWEKNIFVARWQAHHVPNIPHFKLSLWSNEYTFYKKGLCLRLLCGTCSYPPNVLQLFETYCTNPASVSPFHLQRCATPHGVRNLYQRNVELWARNVRSNLALQLRLPR
jgi:hypothetical protein